MPDWTGASRDEPDQRSTCEKATHLHGEIAIGGEAGAGKTDGCGHVARNVLPAEAEHVVARDGASLDVAVLRAVEGGQVVDAATVGDVVVVGALVVRELLGVPL
jgi:hypothetical protein